MLETAMGAVTSARTRLSHVRKPEGEFLLPVWVLHSGPLGQEAPGHIERSVGKEPLVLRAWVIPVAALCIVIAEESKCVQSNVIVHCFL